MIDFMVLALPRSGTTWASNWLCTDTTHCLHDPLFLRHYTDMDSIPSKKVLGVSCTGLWMFPEWVNAHPARKVILHRDISEVNLSLEEVGLPQLDVSLADKINHIDGMHFKWDDIFNDPQQIYEYLTGKEFDEERHSELKTIHMEPDFSRIKHDRSVTARLVKEMHESILA